MHIKKKMIVLWEKNPEGCQACGMKGSKEEILFFIGQEQESESELRQLIESGEIDWRDLSFYIPRRLAECTGLSSMFVQRNSMVEQHG